ncbi:hypothetical protein APA22_42250 (plasmid) [Acetobacter pasteurianus IFO 3283-22]|uniref:Uncharacterized protein n=3 Tax=Acetobacter pasteurianus TaxID=438 RepID=A0A1Y0Y9F6_ACEPA|nr:hypothetical protein S1001342_02754 [Acetobacter pasteurianus subsp. pasteurianus]BAI01012.1 hypothetical protein APA01_42250 [Acetobacter pasteurianus IFO 3283-01]BAI04060.1 hypothetical protein APA03_42250 [Acetobacter pasteurianus IFO 3283-03]BAI07107.1 hypothetical protein APA07_42250 [Acetobacter pasteurianus IFO 3283-07]BAI10155.1 hypothetical protein APA22_42250 [Acetobacter pasteurianus IFO 3283-22]BAI13203.1 hypothetical protein APA26_42250 [Acetobacter pasteurianus IFO 3283-26]BA
MRDMVPETDQRDICISARQRTRWMFYMRKTDICLLLSLDVPACALHAFGRMMQRQTLRWSRASGLIGNTVMLWADDRPDAESVAAPATVGGMLLVRSHRTWTTVPTGDGKVGISQPGDLPSFSHQPSGGTTEGRREVYVCPLPVSVVPDESGNWIFSRHNLVPCHF